MILFFGVEDEHLAVCAVEAHRKSPVRRPQKERLFEFLRQFPLFAAHAELAQNAVARAHKRDCGGVAACLRRAGGYFKAHLGVQFFRPGVGGVRARVAFERRICKAYFARQRAGVCGSRFFVFRNYLFFEPADEPAAQGVGFGGPDSRQAAAADLRGCALERRIPEARERFRKLFPRGAEIFRRFKTGFFPYF